MIASLSGNLQTPIFRRSLWPGPPHVLTKLVNRCAPRSRIDELMPWAYARQATISRRSNVAVGQPGLRFSRRNRTSVDV